MLVFFCLYLVTIILSSALFLRAHDRMVIMREPIQYTGNRITSETRNYGMQEINYHEMAQYIIVSR